METKKYIPGKMEDRARPDGFVFEQIKKELAEHNHCGTPECCGTCDTADKGDSDG